ncbi:hypothetical protein Taro_020813 [Colocasia esculenta]|uniref:Uncharacterized protein n=1 Tax=Colocasia esculenta TaxID=4460 RepID=A0A843UXC7_COLES|nr:hypothetical protein [Colocasia esculenta]
MSLIYTGQESRERERERGKKQRPGWLDQMEMVRSSSSCCMGVMAVVAVSGSVALLSVQMHRRLGNEFRRRAEEELLGLQGGGRSDRRCETTAAATTKMKKVRFADDVVEPSSDSKDYRRRHHCSSTRPAPNGRPNVYS